MRTLSRISLASSFAFALAAAACGAPAGDESNVNAQPIGVGGVVNVDGYFDGLLGQFDRAVAEGLLQAPHRGLVVAAPDAETLLDTLNSWTPPALEFKLDWQST